jgi:hypothetical protein
MSPDLASLVIAWPNLSEPIKAAIRALVASAESSSERVGGRVGVLRTQLVAQHSFPGPLSDPVIVQLVSRANWWEEVL